MLQKNSDAANQLLCGRQTGRKRTYSMSLERESGNKSARECYHMEGQCIWARKVESMSQTIEVLAARVSILEEKLSSVQPMNSKAHCCPVGGCDKSFNRSDHLHRHLTTSPDSEHKKHSVLLNRKYCFPCNKSFGRPSDLLRHERKRHKGNNGFEEDSADQQPIAKNSEALTDGSGLEDSRMHPSSRVSNSSQVTPPKSYSPAGQSGDVSTDGSSGIFAMEESQAHPSSRFSNDFQVPPPESYCTDGQAGGASTNGGGFFGVEDLYNQSPSRFSNDSQVPPPESYCTDGQAGGASTNGRGFFGVEDSYDCSPTLLNSSNYTSGQAGNTFDSGSGFLTMEDLHEHSQILPGGRNYASGLAGGILLTRESGFFGVEDFHEGVLPRLGSK